MLCSKYILSERNRSKSWLNQHPKLVSQLQIITCSAVLPSTGAWPLHAQNMKRATQRTFPTITICVFLPLKPLKESLSISRHQHGFLPHRPWLFNLLIFEKSVTSIMDEDHTVDFAKAFDSVNHRLLLAKIKSVVMCTDRRNVRERVYHVSGQLAAVRHFIGYPANNRIPPYAACSTNALFTRPVCT